MSTWLVVAFGTVLSLHIFLALNNILRCPNATNGHFNVKIYVLYLRTLIGHYNKQLMENWGAKLIVCPTLFWMLCNKVHKW